MAASKELTDDVRLAHLMADDADSISLSRFKAQDLQFRSKPDSTKTTAGSAMPQPGKISTTTATSTSTWRTISAATISTKTTATAIFTTLLRAPVTLLL